MIKLGDFWNWSRRYWFGPRLIFVLIVVANCALSISESEANHHHFKSSIKRDDIAASSSKSDSQTHCDRCISPEEKNRWIIPALLSSGETRYYLGIFFKANWYRAAQYCRYHGMNLASVPNQQENDQLEKYITEFGYGHEHFWTSGTDLAEEGNFFWMANGRPIVFTNWNTGEPNNFRYESGEEEHCLELWNRDGKGLKWNDSPCSFETFFICQLP